MNYLLSIKDIRLAYLFIKQIIGHSNSSFLQRYSAFLLLASASNYSRHLNIQKRNLFDLLRNDFEMENQVQYFLYPNQISGLFSSSSLLLIPILMI